jgi:uncharacterized protein (DUF433 family)
MTDLGGGVEVMDEASYGLKIVGRQIERRHAGVRETPLDHPAQLRLRVTRQVRIGRESGTFARASGVAVVAAGAMKLEEALAGAREEREGEQKDSRGVGESGATLDHILKEGEWMMASLDWSQCPAVESVPGKRSGAWVFKDTRMPVSTVFENFESGATIDEIMEWFDVTREQIVAVLEFAARSLDAPPVDSGSLTPVDANSL